MGTFAVWHPDVEAFIEAKRQDGRLRKFNLSLLIDDEFMDAVKHNRKYQLVFPVKQYEIDSGIVKGKLVEKKIHWEKWYCEKQGYLLKGDNIICQVWKEIEAKELWNKIMLSTYDFAEPGFLLIDRINEYNNNYFVEVIRATNPCGEQPLPPYGACLLGSINLALFVLDPFTEKARFDWETYIEVVRIFTRMLDNVVELNGLPLPEQRREIEYKRRHGMGYTGLGTALSLMGITYGSNKAIDFTEKASKLMAIEGFQVGLELAKEKGPAPIFNDYTNGISNKELWVKGKYMQRILDVRPDLKEGFLEHGCRFTHHTSIAPTGTISYAVNNNVSNGIEPTFAHHYVRNKIMPGTSVKKAIPVYSYEMLLYKALTGKEEVPAEWSTTDNITPKAHIDMQAVAQKWVDSSISKTINVPTDTKFEDFKDIYMYAYEKGLKGCTTFRYNPETLQGVLVRTDDLESTEYIFYLEGDEKIIAKGSDMITYNGEEVTAQNLYDAIKEGYYGRN